MSDEPRTEQERLAELRESGKAVGKLAEDTARFERVVEAFRAQDQDAFHRELVEGDLANQCRFICRWLCSKHCVFICVKLCGPIAEQHELEVNEIREFAQVTARISGDEELLRRLVDLVERQDVEAWRSLIAQLGFERFCHQLCHWLCFVRCRLVCRLLCPDPPLITEVGHIPTNQIDAQGYASGPSVPAGHTPADDKPNGHGDHPFGGRTHIEGEYFSITGVTQYKVEWASSPAGPWNPILAPMHDLQLGTGGLQGYQRAPDSQGWYDVADIGLLGPTQLTDWDTPAPDGLYYLKLTVRTASLTEYASPVVPVLVDNTAPTGPAPGGRPRITIRQGDRELDCCETVTRAGGPLTITVEATDDNFSLLTVDLEGGCGAAYRIYRKTYNGNTADTGAPSPSISIVWNPWTEDVSPCCYVMYVRIWDRAIVNNEYAQRHSNSNWHSITIA